MIQPPEPGQSTRQSTFPFAIPSIIMGGGGQYPPFFDVSSSDCCIDSCLCANAGALVCYRLVLQAVLEAQRLI